MDKKHLFFIGVICLLLNVIPVSTARSVSAHQPSLIPAQMQAVQAAISILLLDEEDNHQLFLPLVVR